VLGQPIMYAYKGKPFLVVNASGNFSPDSYNHSVRSGAMKKGYVVFALPDRN
jgi:quinoprotein glucose dehydrogenase